MAATMWLRPGSAVAHPDPEDCRATGYGEIEDLAVGGSVYVYQINLRC